MTQYRTDVLKVVSRNIIIGILAVVTVLALMYFLDQLQHWMYAVGGATAKTIYDTWKEWPKTENYESEWVGGDGWVAVQYTDKKESESKSVADELKENKL